MRPYKADLHIHTCLSACAELDMTPSKIVKRAKEIGLEIIAITDHNSGENIPACEKVAGLSGPFIIPGMEVTSVEEIHTIGLFEDYKTLHEFQKIVYRNLRDGEFDKRYGYQVIVNEKDEILSFSKRMLISATNLTIKEVVELIHKYGGIAIASHIDKEVFSVISQIGFIPDDIRFDAIEISPHMEIEEAKKAFHKYSGISFIKSSDAHQLKDIGRCTTTLLMEELNFTELKKAIMKREERNIIYG